MTKIDRDNIKTFLNLIEKLYLNWKKNNENKKMIEKQIKLVLFNY